jgi:protein tyrosine phosphatase (PTP) superfamily phosphohydrolase (DUF442 family)
LINPAEHSANCGLVAPAISCHHPHQKLPSETIWTSSESSVNQLDIAIRHKPVFRHKIREESLVDLQLSIPQLRCSRDSASSNYYGLAQSWYDERRDG